MLFLTGGLVVPFVWWSARKRTALFDHVEVIVDDAGIRSNLPAAQGFMAWEGIEKIDRGSGWYSVHSATWAPSPSPGGEPWGQTSAEGSSGSRFGTVSPWMAVEWMSPADNSRTGRGLRETVGHPDGQFVGFRFGRGIRSSAERYSDDEGLSATAKRRCVQASPSRPRRLRLCPSAKCA